MPSVWGQRCPRPSRGGRSPASLSALAKVQRASCLPAGVRGCMWGGSFLIPPFIPGLQFQGAAAGVSREDGRGGQKGAGRVGEAEGELTFCAPRRRHETLGHMAFPSGLSVPTHLHREGEEVERRKEAAAQHRINPNSRGGQRAHRTDGQSAHRTDGH